MQDTVVMKEIPMSVDPPKRGSTSLHVLAFVLFVAAGLPLALTGTSPPRPAPARPAKVRGSGPVRVIAWNDLGMHCLDPDFSVFSILPPFNTLNAQVINGSNLQQSPGGLSVTFEGVADPSGSINTTSASKTNFWDHVTALFGSSPPVDTGLTGTMMPGLSNTPQPMHFNGTYDWFQGEGIPMTPIDDALQKNPYPLLRVVVRDNQQQVIASTVTTAPNSTELECRYCHASGASPFAKPSSGWAFDPNPARDDRLNILRLHDALHLSDPAYVAALQSAGYSATGLYDTVVSHATPILCARCHSSNALTGTGLPGIKPLTQAIHGRHASARTPEGLTLDEIPTRESCFLCHPGRDTQCMRGAMGTAIGADGKHQMHCQSCHGDMSNVADPHRVGWLDQPTCQNCHTGTATNNSGAIRFTSAFDLSGNPHVAADNRFATQANVPSSGFSLYRFSKGHHGLQCSACHGPPHAIYPSAFDNDNLQMEQIQGHKGTLTDCSVCHDHLEDDEIEGPHFMHPVNQKWVVDTHKDAYQQKGAAYCQACHGQNLDGTVLSLAQGSRSYQTPLGVKEFDRGSRIGCFACHPGPNNNNNTNNGRPIVMGLTGTTPNDTPRPFTLTGTDPNGDPLSYRIVSQPHFGHGTVALNGTLATFLPHPGFTGSTFFTYVAWDGKIDSRLGTVAISVTGPACAGTITNYGFGCPGTGEFLPTLTVSGCPLRGNVLTLDVNQGLGGATALIVLGSDRANIPLAVGCIQRVSPILSISPALTLSGAGAGQGSFSLPITIPQSLQAGRYTVQVFIADPGGAGGVTSTNAVEVVIP